MDNLIFSLNATVPIFLLMVLGFILNKLGLIDDVFASKMNKFVFLVPLPVLLFEDLSTVDFSQVWNLKFVLFCFAVTLISIIIAALASFLWRRVYRENLFRRRTAAAPHSWVLRLSRIYTGMQGWLLL